MKKDVILVSIFAAATVVLSAFIPLAYADAGSNETISITTSIYHGQGVKNIVAKVTESEAKIIRQRLEQMNDALERGDKNGVLAGISFLERKGLFSGDEKEAYSLLYGPDTNHAGKFNLPAAYGNISNMLCYVQAAGRGLMIFTIGYILAIFAANGIVLPFAIYIAILMLTHFIPLRVLLPVGIIVMEEGRISTLGLAGLQTQDTTNGSIMVNVVGFTGIVINIPFSKSDSGPFMFVSGMALMAKPGGLPTS